jgi:hypothetical protein
MKSKLFIEKPSNAWTPTTLTIKSVGMIALAWLSFQTSVQETIEVKYSKPSWYFGVGGANFNFYRGSTQH